MDSKQVFEARMRYLDASKMLVHDIVLIYGRMLHGQIDPELFADFQYHLQQFRNQLYTAEMDIVRTYYQQQYTNLLPAVQPTQLNRGPITQKLQLSEETDKMPRWGEK